MNERKSLNTKPKAKYVDALKELADSTRIPQIRLLEEAIEDLLKKYGKEVK
jgi:predicted transcriptional regulator